MPQAPASTETWSASGRPTPAGTETCSASNRPALQPGVPTAGFELETSYSAANHPNHSTVPASYPHLTLPTTSAV